MVEKQAEGVVLGEINDMSNSPRVGAAFCMYAVGCFVLASIILREPLDWGYILIFLIGALYLGWYLPSRPKNHPANVESVPPQVVALVDEIRRECGVTGIRVISHPDVDHPDFEIVTDGLRVSTRVSNEWDPQVMAWAIRKTLYRYQPYHWTFLLTLAAFIPALAVVSTTAAKNPSWTLVLGVLLFFVSIVTVGSFVEKRSKQAALNYAQSFEPNTDAASFALSYPYFAQLDEFRAKDRTWVNTDTYEEAAKHLGIKLSRTILKQELNG
ncbi:MAG TPA: hypothetical protein VK171_08555 [Fimbriimonas sp.]|nr:hypothetical protein [Fimbriimonas sp.]